MTEDQHLAPYLAVLERIDGLARSGRSALDDPVPACPGWTARRTIAHLAGLAEDWVAGRLDGYGSDAWAGAQADRFDGRSIEDVLDAWAAAAALFADLGPSPIGGTAAMWAFGDAVVHEADLRPVLAPGTTVPAESMTLGLKAAIARWRAELGAAGVPPLDVVASDLRTWRVGPAGEPAATVTTTANELFRGLFGRRSLQQAQAWDWRGDPQPYLAVPLPYPFRWAEQDLID
ncbi:MAG: maleylpyruvate isomerase family mycothiol-dependent enzyme [Actinomycetota bacterium]